MSNDISGWSLSPRDVFATGPVVPVLVIPDADTALPIAEALMEGGIHILEVTLRTPSALDVIEKLATSCPDALVGAGTVTDQVTLKAATSAGAQFMISPGLTDSLLKTAVNQTVPLIPGVSTISELMTGIDYGLDHFKFFPAEASGGIRMLKSIAGPFPDVHFCPTGGINEGNALDYLSLPNVDCIGGSWLVTREIIENRNWQQITRLAKAITAQVQT